jgi:Skp family chaperone for outer membrane proteins
MKQVLAFVIGGVIVLVAATARPRTAAPTMVTVSIQRLAAQSDAGKRANQQLDALRLERQRELATKQKELEDIARQLTRNQAMPLAERERLTQDETRRRAELQQLTQQAQATFQAAQTKLQTELRGQLVPILADIAKRYGTDFVLNSDTAVAWAAPGTDATDEVLRRLNALPQ